MTPEQYAAHALGLAMGVVGWSPEVARQATFAEIELAVQAKARFLGGSPERGA